MAYLTFNADDFGMTPEVTLGIHQAITNGIVTSTSAMACVEGAKESLQKYAVSTPGAIGAHLQLTDGKPILPAKEIPSLVRDDGRFYRKSKDMSWTLDETEIYNEWKAQLNQLKEWGIEPDYLDTHHHVHMKFQVLPVYAKLAKEMKLPVRSGSSKITSQLRYLGVSCPDVTITGFFGEDLTQRKMEELVLKELQNYGPEAVIEVCCHPGISSPELETMSYYTKGREIELAMLTKKEGKARLEELGFSLIGMNEVMNLKPMINEKTITQ